MLIDLIDSENYIFVNVNLINVLGLSGAVYCSELFSILKKAIRKKKLVEECAIKVDRNYIQTRTAISIEDQLAIDKCLESMDLINKYSKDAPDSFTVNVPGFITIISGVDSLSNDELDKLRKKLQPKTPESKREGKRLGRARAIKESIVYPDIDVKNKLCEWVDMVVIEAKRQVTERTAAVFVNTLKEYVKDDKDMALDIIQIAITNSYVDVNYAIDSYEKRLKKKDNTPRTTRQSRATRDDITGGSKF